MSIDVELLDLRSPPGSHFIQIRLVGWSGDLLVENSGLCLMVVRLLSFS